MVNIINKIKISFLRIYPKPAFLICVALEAGSKLETYTHVQCL